MRQLFFCLIFLSSITLLDAQKYDNVWMNGTYDNYYIDFATFPPSIYPVSTQYAFASTLSFMNDINGAPSFYSNGCTIHNWNHELMENGDSLLHNDYFCVSYGDMNYAHSASVTLPGFLPQQYIIFSLSLAYPSPLPPCESDRLVAHYVDMAANQGKGKVTEKEQILLTGCFQAPCANRHANGRDWWILLPDNQQGRFFRWLLTPSGLEGPWEQVIENPIVKGYAYCGWSEFSPDGERYMISTCLTGVALYNFDRCSGLLSNPILLKHSSAFNGPATFSPNSKLLYKSENLLQELEQYDLTASDIESSRQVVAIWDGTVDSFHIQTAFANIQQGPDGKLYIWANASYNMHVVDFPDRRGVNCKVRQRAIQLLGYSAGIGHYYPRYRLGPVDGSSCDTLGIDNHPAALFRYDLEDTLSPLQVTFTDASSYQPTAWHWDFGDGTMSQDTNPIHPYAAAGTYNVCLIVSNIYAADTFCRTVTVGTSGIQEFPALPQAKVWPNPFSGEFRIQLPALVGAAPRFVLSDLYGRQVTNVELHDFETVIRVPGISTGVYLWQLFLNGVQIQQGKLVKGE